MANGHLWHKIGVTSLGRHELRKLPAPLSYRQDEWQIGGETEDLQKGEMRHSTGERLGAAEIPAEVL